MSSGWLGDNLNHLVDSNQIRHHQVAYQQRDQSKNRDL